MNPVPQEGLSIHERAVYGAFSGNLKLLLNACTSWEDYLWAYLRVMVDSRVEQELRDMSSAERGVDVLPHAYWAKKLVSCVVFCLSVLYSADFSPVSLVICRLTAEQIFEEIEASSKQKIKMESSNFYRIIQKYIILDDIDGLFLCL